MPKIDELARSKKAVYFESDDAESIAAEIEEIGAKSVLEFGPGDSTQSFLDMGIENIATCEYIDKWLKVAQKRFKDDSRVRVLRFTDTVPVTVDGLDGNEQFDLGFVDAPKGFRINGRVMHPEFPDCSRMNACLFALERCKVVLLHDARRPCERATLGRLHSLGYDYEFIPSRIGMARITKREKRNRPDLPRAKKSRRATAGASA